MTDTTILEYPGRPVSDYDEAILKARHWLTSQQRTDGSVGDNVPLWGYYTQAMAFRAMGEPACAVRCLNFIKKQFLKENGLLQHERDPMNGFTYAPSWTVINSQIWERFDISYPVSRWILQFQDSETGGFFTTFEEARKGAGVIDFDATTISGIALVTVGRIEEAKRVGNYLLQLHKEQPDLKRRYLFVWETGKGVVDSYEDSQALFFAVVRGKERQAYWKSALAISLLTKLHLATGVSQYLDLAKKHFEFVSSFADVYKSARSHKLCWASALLYQATGEQRFLEAAKKVGDHLISLQKSDGRYHYPEASEKFENQSLVDNLDIVSQFTTWIASARWVRQEP